MPNSEPCTSRPDGRRPEGADDHGRATTPHPRAGRPTRPGAGAPDGAHEWMSFPDPDDERTWLFDVTFLESNWTCIFGRGCQGVMTGPAPELVQGCCSYGAHFTGPKDARRVEAAAATLTPEQWQFWRQGQATDGARPRVVKRSPKGDLTTRLVKDACIFLNRPDFPGGRGLRPSPCAPSNAGVPISSSSPTCAGSCRCDARTRWPTTAT